MSKVWQKRLCTVSYIWGIKSKPLHLDLNKDFLQHLTLAPSIKWSRGCSIEPRPWRDWQTLHGKLPQHIHSNTAFIGTLVGHLSCKANYWVQHIHHIIVSTYAEDEWVNSNLTNVCGRVLPWFWENWRYFPCQVQGSTCVTSLTKNSCHFSDRCTVDLWGFSKIARIHLCD